MCVVWPSPLVIDVVEELASLPLFRQLSCFSLKGTICLLTSWRESISDNDSRTYKVSSPIIAYYYTQLIGDARKPPTLLAAANFVGMAVIGMSLIFCLPQGVFRRMSHD